MSHGEFDPNSHDAVLARTIAVLERVEKKMDEHESRIRKLESRQIWIIGVSSGVVFMANKAWEWVTGGGPSHH